MESKERRLVDGLKYREAKVEHIMRFSGTTSAARIYLQELIERMKLSRVTKDVMHAMLPTLGHYGGVWCLCPNTTERRIILACLRISYEEYERAIDEACSMRCFERGVEAHVVRVLDEYVPTYNKGSELVRFAVSSGLDHKICSQAEFESYDEDSE